MKVIIKQENLNQLNQKVSTEYSVQKQIKVILVVPGNHLKVDGNSI